jgi:hypothetical protein
MWWGLTVDVVRDCGSRNGECVVCAEWGAEVGRLQGVRVSEGGFSGGGEEPWCSERLGAQETVEIGASGCGCSAPDGRGGWECGVAGFVEAG